MSVRVSSLIWMSGPSKAPDRLMLLALADIADDYGLAWPGMARLAEKCCVTEDSARATVRRLEAAGWVTVVRGGGTRDGVHGIPNRYQINLERLDSATPPSSRDSDIPTPPSSPSYPPVEPIPTPPWTGGETSVEPSEVQPSLVVVADDPPPKDEAKRQPKRAVQLPESWMPNDQHLAFVRANNLNGGVELAQFRDHHTARGSTMRDWDAAFRTWLRNASKWQGGAGLRSVPGTSADPNAWMRRPGVGG